MCVYVCIYTYTYVCACVYTYIYIYIYIHIIDVAHASKVTPHPQEEGGGAAEDLRMTWLKPLGQGPSTRDPEVHTEGRYSALLS